MSAKAGRLHIVVALICRNSRYQWEKPRLQVVLSNLLPRTHSSVQVQSLICLNSVKRLKQKPRSKNFVDSKVKKQQQCVDIWSDLPPSGKLSHMTIKKPLNIPGNKTIWFSSLWLSHYLWQITFLFGWCLYCLHYMEFCFLYLVLCVIRFACFGSKECYPYVSICLRP